MGESTTHSVIWRQNDIMRGGPWVGPSMIYLTCLLTDGGGRANVAEEAGYHRLAGRRANDAEEGVFRAP